MSEKPFRRILIKLSGETLNTSSGDFGICPKAVANIAEDIVELAHHNISHCMVVGGGNMFRGANVPDMDRVTADYIGMLATVMNALALQQAIEALNQEVRVQSAVPMHGFCEPFIRKKALRHIEKGRTIIFAAGTGNPFFSTDTAAALRASEMNCSDVFKATKVDGVYDKDPVTHKDAVKFDRLTFREVQNRNLHIMDDAAVSLCRSNQIPITVFNVFEKGSLLRVVNGEGKFTRIHSSKEKIND